MRPIPDVARHMGLDKKIQHYFDDIECSFLMQRSKIISTA